jgi:hypothetical protein
MVVADGFVVFLFILLKYEQECRMLAMLPGGLVPGRDISIMAWT